MCRIHQMLMVTVCLFVTVAIEIEAKDKLTMIEGLVVSARDGTLVIRDETTRNHTLTVTRRAQVIVDGDMGALEDVWAGMKADVTLDAGEVIVVNATKPSRRDANRHSRHMRNSAHTEALAREAIF